MRSEGALQRLIMGTCVASMIVPTVPMRFAPSWARGEGAVTSLLPFAHVGHGGHKGAKWAGCIW